MDEGSHGQPVPAMGIGVIVRVESDDRILVRTFVMAAAQQAQRFGTCVRIQSIVARAGSNFGFGFSLTVLPSHRGVSALGPER